ncbi:myelin expression factor 2-like [Bacillus rossius redtenbacheri]|uniref:myelin expression factor 2-like n=1 Tax=Bacillus rossius redtenbacheri TaxID=93214 RepID=UPI002FDD229B
MDSDNARDRSPLRDLGDRGRERTRRDKPSRFGPRASSDDRDESPCGRRVFVSNIPYEFGWQDLKDLFRKEVGKVVFVELFNDENNKPRGCGIVEFESVELARIAVEKMHRYELQNRNLVVKKDFDAERDKYGRLVRAGGGGGGGPDGGNSDRPPRVNRDDRNKWNQQPRPLVHNGGGPQKWTNTYGLSPQFLESLGVSEPLVNRVFVANLDYKVDSQKLKEVFKLAGKVQSAEVSMDKEGKSRGFGVVEYDHPVEAVQAISMLNNQMLYDRKLAVRMDRVDHKPDGPPRLPEGLRSVGMGLGAGGNPLHDVARNLPNIGQEATGLAASLPQGATALSSLGQLQGVIGQAGLAGLGGAAGLGGLGGAASLLGAAGGDLGLSANLASSALAGSSLGATLGLAAGGLSGARSSLLAAGAGGGVNALGAFGAPSRDFDMGGGAGGGRDVRPSIGSGGPAFANGPSQNMPPSGAPGARRSDAVIIRNLGQTVTWQKLRDKFREVGEVKFTELHGKDMGLVRFTNDWDAQRAVHMMDRSRFEGRTIEVCLY